jgi:pimeloyl-ACP methyl ester carboxylesterase
MFGQEDGEPLILITGYGTARDLWPRSLIEPLSENFKVITFDNRGVWETTRGDSQVSIFQMARDTIGLMDALFIKRANILGWSMGSLIAQEVALKVPDRVSRLALYATKCGGPEEVPPEEWVLEALTDTEGTMAERYKRMNSTMFPKEFLEKHPDPRDFYPHVEGYASDDIIIAQSMAFYNWPGTHDKLQNIRIPTLLIAGDADAIIPIENSKIIHKKIKHSRLEILEGAGHGAMFQFPEIFSKKVVDFLEKG